MLTIEVFLATMSTIVVAATAVLLWILTEFRAIRKEIKEGFESERQQRQTEREIDRRERQAEREADRQERRADTQRILEALYFHRHDPNTGEAAFYPPTPATPAPPAD